MIKYSNIYQIIVALIFSTSILSSFGQMIDIVATQTILGPDVLLRDIVNDASILPDGWGQRYVAKLATPGKATKYTLFSIATALQKYPDMQDVILRGQTTLVLSRKGAHLTTDHVTTAIESFVRSQKEWQNKSVTITVKKVDPSIIISDDAVEISIKEYHPQKEPMHYTFILKVTMDGAKQSIVKADVKIMPMQNVWAARKAITRGQLLSKNDIEYRLLSLDETARLIPASEDITGMEANRPIRPGQTLSRAFLLEPQCAKRGETINVTLNNGSLSITMRATALKEGRKGDSIFCLNSTSKRRLMVKLTGIREGSLNAN